MKQKQPVETTDSPEIAVFKGNKIRKTIHNNEWWFSVVDITGALTDSIDPGAYWRKLKERLKKEGSEVVTNCHGLKQHDPELAGLIAKGGSTIHTTPYA